MIKSLSIINWSLIKYLFVVNILKCICIIFLFMNKCYLEIFYFKINII